MPRRGEKKKPRVSVYLSHEDRYLSQEEVDRTLFSDRSNVSPAQPLNFQSTPYASEEIFRDLDTRFPSPVRQETEASATGNILQLLQKGLKCLWVSQDRREAHYVQPGYDCETGEVQEGQASFVGVRFVKYEDKKRMVSWCNNRNCPDSEHRAEVANCFHATDFTSLAAETHLEGLQTKCLCSSLLIRAEGGGLSLRSYLEEADNHFQVA